MEAICPICSHKEDVTNVAGIGSPEKGQRINVGCGECGEGRMVVI